MTMRNGVSGFLVSAFLAVFAFAAATGFMAPQARAEANDDAARAFIQTSIDRGIAILKDKSLTEKERNARVRAILADLLDTRRIGLYALGDVRTKASRADLDAYLVAFRSFMIESYVSRLGGYGGQTLKITGVIDHAPGDYVVRSVLVDPANPGDPDPVHVDFRVFDENGAFAIVDADIAGVSLGRAQKSDFTGFLGQHNNSVPALTERLKTMTAEFTAPKQKPAAP